MGIFDFLKPGKSGALNSYFSINLSSDELKPLIVGTIQLFWLYPNATHQELIEAITRKTNNDELALALYRFIPIAVCRLFIPEVHYSDEYIVTVNDEKKTFLFSQDDIYQLVLSVCRKQLQLQLLSQDNIIAILVHSADFNAVNDALNNGAQLKDLVCSPAYFL